VRGVIYPYIKKLTISKLLGYDSGTYGRTTRLLRPKQGSKEVVSATILQEQPRQDQNETKI
jgi:hypothetical protein